MAKIAVDVVLLPSTEMMERAIAVNKELLKRGEAKIVLDKERCLPHISLCMGCIDEEKLPVIEAILDGIAAEFSAFRLEATAFGTEVIPTGKTVSFFTIGHQDGVQKLHETVMGRLWPYLSYDVTVPMLFNPPEVEEVTLYWIRGYAKKYGDPSMFRPHITVGFGKTDGVGKPIPFSASRIALCHLGNYCTCRRILISSDLR